jgi:hypothetical protein
MEEEVEELALRPPYPLMGTLEYCRIEELGDEELRRRGYGMRRVNG